MAEYMPELVIFIECGQLIFCPFCMKSGPRLLFINSKYLVNLWHSGTALMTHLSLRCDNCLRTSETKDMTTGFKARHAMIAIVKLNGLFNLVSPNLLL